MAVLVSKGINVPNLGKRLSDFAVGETVKLNVNGVPKDFIVTHHGLPSSIYDSSCNGTWLLMKNVHEKAVWNSSGSTKADFSTSTMKSYLEGTVLPLFDDKVQNAILTAKIPYISGGTVYSGKNGCAVKLFPYSSIEYGFYSGTLTSSIYKDGAKLDYFKEGTDDSANALRTAKDSGGTACVYWTRSPVKGDQYDVQYIQADGNIYTYGRDSADKFVYVRFGMILPSNSFFDPNTLEFKGVR